MREILKPCPFCDGEAELAIVKLWNHVYCKSCHARTTMYSSEGQAIEAWNTRSNPWHTGMPTEYGLYLVQYIHGGYDVVLYDPSASGWDIYSDDSPKDIVKWQKIELEGRKEK